MNILKSVTLSLMLTLFIISHLNGQLYSNHRKFNSTGKFKIVQFIDVHFKYNAPRSDSVLTLIKTILSEEKPDLLAITGDVVYSVKDTPIGIHGKEPCSPEINSGLSATMIERKDIIGVFSGHDHDNNYIGVMDIICLTYGCKTGLELVHKKPASC